MRTTAFQVLVAVFIVILCGGGCKDRSVENTPIPTTPPTVTAPTVPPVPVEQPPAVAVYQKSMLLAPDPALYQNGDRVYESDITGEFMVYEAEYGKLGFFGWHYSYDISK